MTKQEESYMIAMEFALKEMIRAFKEHGNYDLNNIPMEGALNMMRSALRKRPRKTKKDERIG